MAYDPGLAQRIREVLGEHSGTSEKAMFGGLAFLVDGKMFVGINGETLMARVGPVRHAEVLTLPYVRPMDFTGRPMKGYVFVDPPGIERDEVLSDWVQWCKQFAASLPAKKPVKGRA